MEKIKHKINSQLFYIPKPINILVNKRIIAVKIYFIIILSITITLYYFEAMKVSSCIYEDNAGIMWRSSPPGSFIPWPKPSGILLVMSDVNFIDSMIYVYMIKTGTLKCIVMLAWIFTSIYIVKVLLHG
jgi:hypothetical protein